MSFYNHTLTHFWLVKNYCKAVSLLLYLQINFGWWYVSKASKEIYHRTKNLIEYAPSYLKHIKAMETEIVPLHNAQLSKLRERVGASKYLFEDSETLWNNFVQSIIFISKVYQM